MHLHYSIIYDNSSQFIEQYVRAFTQLVNIISIPYIPYASLINVTSLVDTAFIHMNARHESILPYNTKSMPLHGCT